MEAILFWVCLCWFTFYLINHATLFSRPRAAFGSITPNWLVSLLKCPLCLSWWIMVFVQIWTFILYALSAVSLFWGYIPLMVICPPLTLMLEMAYQRLKK